MSPGILLLVGLFLAAAFYVHMNLRHFVASRSALVAAHGVLIVVGLGLGYVSAASTEADLHWAAWLGAFGVVHVPAAVVLFVKRARHSPKS